jgi:Uma2 family endonuclease
VRVNTTDLQNAFGKYLALVEKEDIVVVKNGKSIAKLTRYREPDFVIVHEESKSYRSPRKISYEEYMELVESSDQRYELINGEIYLLASPGFNHQVAVNEIAVRFYYYFKDKPCRSLTAPLDVRLFGFATKFEEDPNVVQPDVMIICDEEKISEDNKYEGVPALIVEVLSPSTKGKDMAVKLQLYMKSGVLEYWIVDLMQKNIIQYAFSQGRDIKDMYTFTGDDTINSAVFEGLKIPLKDIFN